MRELNDQGLVQHADVIGEVEIDPAQLNAPEWTMILWRH
jgi:hypothetical protein